jgi:hypothetical protein
MVELSSLWFPIILSAVVVFIISTFIHMVLPWHKGEYPKMPNEEKVMDALRPLNIPPGDYMVPRAQSMEEMKSTEYKDKLAKGPVMVVTVLPNGQMNMGKSLFFWFLYSLVVSFFAAYVAGRALTPEATYLQVFRFVGVTSFIGYSLALWQLSIWYNRSLATTIKANIDGFIYALFTAGVFGWLWPR